MQGKLTVLLGLEGSEYSKMLHEIYHSLLKVGIQVKHFSHASSNNKKIPYTTYIDEIEDVFTDDLDQTEVILIDNIHLFDSLDTSSDLLLLLKDGIDVYVSGTLTTPDGKVCEEMAFIVSMADEIIKIRKKCDRCDNTATWYGEGNTTLCPECFFSNDSTDDEIYYFDLDRNEFRLQLYVSKKELEEAGYTKEDVEDIETLEGANNLLHDLGYLYNGGDNI